jgi:hypothetical protein
MHSVRPVKTFAELEASAEIEHRCMRDACWKWAVAITRIHDSKLYPGAGEPNGFYTYRWKRWELKKAQAANFVAWVHHEIKLTVMPVLSLEDQGSTTVDFSKQEAPAEPKHRTEGVSRAARKANSQEKR